MRFWYSALLTILLPLVLLRMLWRSRRAPAYRQRWAERFGYFKPVAQGQRQLLWVHAVSLGEVRAAVPLIEQLLLTFPGHAVLVTTTTPTGFALVNAHFEQRVHHVYAPWDLPGCVQRFLRRTRPALLVLVETELWPNLVHYSHAQGCPVVLVNGRMSEQSARGYGRLAGLTREMLSEVDHIACQTRADAERFEQLGASPQALTVTGNLKFDWSLDESQQIKVRALQRQFTAGGRPVLIAASTHAQEEQFVLAAFRLLRQTVPNCLLLLVPRHPERFDLVCRLCAGEGWQTLRHSHAVDPGPRDDILLVDTVGELPLLYAAATVAFIGGSLVGRGGHNPLEAVAHGVPVVSGPSVYNFAEVFQLLGDAGASVMVTNADQLGPCLAQLFQDRPGLKKMSDAGQAVMQQNRGATATTLHLLAQNLHATA